MCPKKDGRKRAEKLYHNLIRDHNLRLDMSRYVTFTSNEKYYSVDRKSRMEVEEWLKRKISGRKVLDYCCGNGDMAIWMAQHRASQVHAIDISNISIENGMKRAEMEGVSVFFHVMDAEQLGFPDSSFDFVYESGVLHHLRLSGAYTEIARVLAPGGEAICIEALRHNPFIQYYRKRTPQLRTEWEAEHILGKKDILMAREYFNNIQILGFFHLATITAVPFRNSPAFNFVLGALELIDRLLLKLPVLKWHAWQVIFLLSEPKKSL